MRKRKVLSIVISLIISLIVFIGLTVLQKRLVNPNGTERIYVVNKDTIDENTLIDSSNFQTYFQLKNVDSSKVIDGAIKEGEESSIYNRLVTVKLFKGEDLTINRTIDKDSILSDIKEPREICIKGTDISEVVGGIIKTGDAIDIDVIDKTTGQVVKVKSNVYVNSVLTSDGSLVTGENSAALNINIIVDESEQDSIKEKLSIGNLKVSKILKQV